MKHFIKLIFLFLIITLSSSVMAQKDTYLKIKEHTESYTTFFGKKIPEKDETIKIWIGGNSMAIITSETKYVIDLDNNIMILVNTKYETYIEMPLPLDLKSHLDEYALLHYQTYWMRFHIYDLTSGIVEETAEFHKILGRKCKKYKKITKYGNRSVSTIWATTDVSFNLEVYNKMTSYLRMILEYDYTDKFKGEMKKIEGFPLLEEKIVRKEGAEVKTTKKVIEIKRRNRPADLYSIPGDYSKKDKISYKELKNGNLGPVRAELTGDKKEVFTVLWKLQDGYIKRDTTILEEWIDDLFAENFYIVGTEAPYPESWEWRGERNAAIEIFKGDWKYWGDVKMYLDEAFISVEDNSAWVAMLATVSRLPGKDPRYRDAETMRKAVLNVIDDKTKMDWPSRRILYEIIHDASWALVEYERSPDFVWPIRITLDLLKRNGKWLIKNTHWSYTGEGYPLIRFIKYKE
ncbi:DUF4412 domain-containing protein [candidate division KSB1 bacterium]